MSQTGREANVYVRGFGRMQRATVTGVERVFGVAHRFLVLLALFPLDKDEDADYESDEAHDG